MSTHLISILQRHVATAAAEEFVILRTELKAWHAACAHDDETLSESAIEIAEHYVAGLLPFQVANAAVRTLMQLQDWHAPTAFWEIFVALEDLEIHEEPGEPGREHLARALARARAGSTNGAATVRSRGDA